MKTPADLALLDELQALEDEGYVAFIKWDGERSHAKKTLLISHHQREIFIRRDSDDLWGALRSALDELAEQEP